VAVMNPQRTQIRFWMNFCGRHQYPSLPAKGPSLGFTLMRFERLPAYGNSLPFILPCFSAASSAPQNLPQNPPFVPRVLPFVPLFRFCTGSRLAYTLPLANYLSS
jgi:hypothetical protein